MNNYDNIIKTFQQHITAPILSIKRMESEAMNTVYRVDTHDGSFIFKRYTSGWPEVGKVPYVEAKLTEYGIPHAELIVYRRDEDDCKNGYRKIKLTGDDGKLKGFWVSRLVYAAFHGPIPPGYEVDHLDGDRLNNHKDNLSLVTHKQNCVLKKQRDSRTLFNRKAPRKKKKVAA